MTDDRQSLETQDARLAGRILGVVLVLAGLAALGTVIFANAGRSRGAEHLAYKLGLAVAPALSAVGLSLVLIGLFAVLRVGGRR